MPESAYRNIVSESKRVLKPSGYLEMAILDLDMMNMGNRARRAVRGLKVQIQAADPNVSLGSASDLVLKMVGKRGFTDVKTCNVGVPVASAIHSSASSKPTAGAKEPKDKVRQEEMSLADMMRDESPAAGGAVVVHTLLRISRRSAGRSPELAAQRRGIAARVRELERELQARGGICAEAGPWTEEDRQCLISSLSPVWFILSTSIFPTTRQISSC
jgi:hypothetical protein